MVLLHLRHLFYAQNLPLAVATILGHPLSRHVARHALETTAFVMEPDWMQLQSTPSVLTWTAGGSLASSFRGVTPETLPIRTIGNSCDTIENRFVKYSLKQLQQLIKDVRDRVGKSYQASRKQLAEWDALVDELLLHPLWQSVGECSVFPNSMVMYERHGYRDYMQGLMLLDLGLLLESDLGVIDRVTGDLKPIWALYEMWCYFELRTIVEKITGCPGEPTKAQLIRSKDFSTDLIAGKTGCTRFQAQRATSTLDVNLYYNRSFGSIAPDGHDRWIGSYSTNFRPDFSVEIVVGSHVHWVHFDAKYRVAFITTRTKTGVPMTVRTFQSEDVDRMHMYRDAILGTRGCYVLYPGNTNEETVFVRHPKAEYRAKWPGPSVGAFPLCPSSDANQEEQRIRLENHLDRLIRAMEASAGYTEEERIYRFLVLCVGSPRAILKQFQLCCVYRWTVAIIAGEHLRVEHIGLDFVPPLDPARHLLACEKFEVWTRTAGLDDGVYFVRLARMLLLA